MQIIQKILNKNKINTILHDCIINLRGDAGAHKTSLTRSLLLKCLCQARQVSDHTYVY